MINVLLLILAVLPYAAGWLAGKVAPVTRWYWEKFKWGWEDAHKKRQRKQVT